MSKTDQTSGSKPLRQRKSKRFDRSGETPRVGSSAAADVDVDAQVEDSAETTADGGAATATAVVDETELEGATAKAGGEIDSSEATLSGDNSEASDAGGEERAASARPRSPRAPMLNKTPTRSRTLGERNTCGRCGHEVSMVNIEVDSTVLVMESCDNCDTRRWHLAGEQIDLQQALDQVGEHAGRRR